MKGKALILTLAVLLLSVALGAFVESSTHAWKVSRLTGTPYLQVLDPWHRLLGTTNRIDTVSTGSEARDM